MKRDSSDLLFLLRMSGCLIAVLALWWFALRPPLLAALRIGTTLAISALPGSDQAAGITEDEAGDWLFHFPVDDVRTEGGRRYRVTSLDFTMSRSDAVLFTFSIPVFWAIMLGGGIGRSDLTAFLAGTVVMMLLEVLLLLGHADIMAANAVASWHPESAGFSRWLRGTIYYLVTTVIPFLMPIVAGLVFHPRLRARVLGP